MAATFTNSNFEREVLQSNEPVLVDFYASWCGPCKMMSPVIDRLAEEYAGKVKIGKLDVEEQAQIASKFGVRSIPTLLLIKNGKVVDRIVGAVPKDYLEDKLEEVL